MRSSPSQRWSGVVSDEDAKPRGSLKYLKAAVSRLGPFAHKTRDDARYAAVRSSVSEEDAHREIYKLATNFNRHLRLEIKAPRAKDVVNQLETLQRVTDELATLLASFDDITRSRLQTAGSDLDQFIENSGLESLAEAADVAGLPSPGTPDETLKTFSWIHRLEALSEYVKLTTETFKISKGLSEATVLDRGGNKNLFKDVYGSAQWRLVSDAWFCFDSFKPNEATGSDGKSFHMFIQEIFTYATKKDAEKNPSFLPAIKKVVKSHRRYFEVESELMVRGDELRALFDEKMDFKTRELRRIELAGKVIALESELYELRGPLFGISEPAQES
jgi:hypothetical protein